MYKFISSVQLLHIHALSCIICFLKTLYTRFPGKTKTFLIIETIPLREISGFFFFFPHFLVVFTVYSWPLNNMAFRGFDPHCSQERTSSRPLVFTEDWFLGLVWIQPTPRLCSNVFIGKNKSAHQCTYAVQTRVVQSSVVLR